MTFSQEDKIKVLTTLERIETTINFHHKDYTKEVKPAVKKNTKFRQMFLGALLLITSGTFVKIVSKYL